MKISSHCLSASVLTLSTMNSPNTLFARGFVLPSALFMNRVATASSYRGFAGTARTASAAVTATDFERHAPVGQDGEGLYTASTKGCFDVIQTATPAVLEAIEQQLSSSAHGDSRSSTAPSAYSVADYGTADGGTSLGLMSQIVKAVRQKQPNREIWIHYEDQRENEWKSVFNHALGVQPVSDAYGKALISPLVEYDGVFCSASGIGFHDQSFPSNSIDLGVSFTAMHWLSQAPNSLKGSPYMHSAQLEEPPTAESQQARHDWKSILQARARELKPGGRVVIANFCKSRQGYFLGNTDVGANMWESFDHSWNRLYEEGLIDEEERYGISFPNYYRSTKECEEGVQDIPGLKVVECVERIVRCPYREAWNGGNPEGRTPREQGEWFVPTTRTWSESTFKNALKPHQEKDAIMKQFWSNYVDLVAQDPSIHGMDYVHTYLVIEKEKV